MGVEACVTMEEDQTVVSLTRSTTGEIWSYASRFRVGTRGLRPSSAPTATYSRVSHDAIIDKASAEARGLITYLFPRNG